jgi:hypothetical protein
VPTTKTKPLKSFIPPRPTPPLRAVPKGLVPQGLSLEERAARYDRLLVNRKRKRTNKREIARLYAEIDALEAEEAKQLDADIAAGYGESAGGEPELCPNCNYEVCQCDARSTHSF